MFQIKTFRRGDEQPFWEWLHGLHDMQARARIRTRIDRLALGNMGDHRVLDGRVGNTVVLLLCGGDKRSQQQDIRTAKAYLKEYRDAQENL